jgi:radical SAM protein with 4Fe4S-binding SPASM domain
MDTPEREAKFDTYRGEGWEAEYRDYRSKWSELAQTQTVSEYPLLVDIELASVCNLRCPMCYTITDEFKQQVTTTRMNWELYKKIIDEIGGKVPAIRLSLRGEATLHTKFVECIRYAKENGIKEVSTLTHGGKLTLPFFEKIVDAGIDWITISVDGVGETYEKIRKPIKFNELLDKIKAMKRFKDERGLHRPVIKVQGIWPAIKENPQAYYDTFAPCTDLVAFNPLIDYLSKDTEIDYLENFTCPQQYQRLVIGADGLVMKCSNDEENREVIGDANKETVHQLWHGEKMQAVREMHLQPQGFMQSAVCRKCYLPRETNEEEASVDGRTFIVRDYRNRTQEIGK